jgi:hypothetical protein
MTVYVYIYFYTLMFMILNTYIYLYENKYICICIRINIVPFSILNDTKTFNPSPSTFWLHQLHIVAFNISNRRINGRTRFISVEFLEILFFSFIFLMLFIFLFSFLMSDNKVHEICLSSDSGTMSPVHIYLFSHLYRYFHYMTRL